MKEKTYHDISVRPIPETSGRDLSVVDIFNQSHLLLLSSESSADHELRLFPSRRSGRPPSPLQPRQDLNPRRNEDDLTESRPHHLHLHHHHLHQHPPNSAEVMPAALLGSRFRQEPAGQRTLNLLARPHHEVQPEHVAVSARHLVTVNICDVSPPTLPQSSASTVRGVDATDALWEARQSGETSGGNRKTVWSADGVSPISGLTLSLSLSLSVSVSLSQYLAVDVRRLNVSLLRWFREGVAAALGVPAGHVHINRLNEKKNGIELFVSSDRLGISEPRPAEEVIQSLNVRVLHRHLGHFGITEVSTEKNVLQGEQRDHQVWSREGFYAVILFFTIFVIVITCLMVLYRLKEKVQVSDRQLKAPPPDLHLTPTVPPDSAQRSKGTKVLTTGSMVQAELPPTVATPIPQQQPIAACRRLAPPPPVVPLPSPAPAPVINSNGHTPFVSVAPVTASNELKPCPSPFRMKPAAGLQESERDELRLLIGFINSSEN
ncbi:hypothetical protein L3Q82_009234 [Scortum barcoo]|uniref:Uncharacterized protein n=1 Tax=Scortum barcoo TaxID=214431 RepID=A0ACB8WGJ8_9TELE|nr:hypothetical protein L3Q82_009234 [Scortum barcoo]